MISSRGVPGSRIGLSALTFAIVVLLTAAGRDSLAASPVESRGPYAPYEFLIGRWDIAPQQGGAPFATAQFRWGPNHAYIWYAGGFVVNGVERPHFEGLLMWNGTSERLDMLLSMDLEHGLVQEQGSVYIAADDTVVRDITAIYSEGSRPLGQPVAGANGATARFRQTFKSTGPDKIFTTVMRQAGDGWVATFPGSDHLVMTRRAESKPSS